DVPREAVDAERVLESVAGDPARLVERERVQELAPVGDLLATVGPLDDRELAGQRHGLRSAARGQRLPEGEGGAGAEHLAAAVLVVEVKGATLRIDEHLAGAADRLDGDGHCGSGAAAPGRDRDRDADNQGSDADGTYDEQSFHGVTPLMWMGLLFS